MPGVWGGLEAVLKPTLRNHAGRKRRAVGWTLLTLGVFVAGVWMWSGLSWRSWAWGGSAGRWNWKVQEGRLAVTSSTDFARSEGEIFHFAMTSKPAVQLDPDDSVSRVLERLYSQQRWLVDWRPFTRHTTSDFFQSRTTVRFALWPIPLLLWTPAALLLRSGILARRRAITGSCANCGYSLAGLAHGAACPECGNGGKAAAVG